MVRLKLINPKTGHSETFKYNGAQSREGLVDEICLVIQGKRAGLVWELTDGTLMFPSAILEQLIIIVEEVSENGTS